MDYTDSHLACEREPECEHAQDLAALQRDFPGFRIWQEAMGERARLVAVRRQHGTSPHTVVTADLTELRAVLDSHRHTPARS
jgi:hypothetical protein